LLDFNNGRAHLVLVKNMINAAGQNREKQPSPKREFSSLQQDIAGLHLSMVPVNIKNTAG
jgi:hypothetical protein